MTATRKSSSLGVPVVFRPQMAFVVRAEGEEINCDEYGRILVRFHWDRENDQSMRCRVAQNWASKQWGGMIIPRIGMEVMVEFLDGDPDRPLVTGCVYNAQAMPPYKLPEHKTRSIFPAYVQANQAANCLRLKNRRPRQQNPQNLHFPVSHNAVRLQFESAREWS